MKKFYLTFGCGHPLGDNFMEIEAEDLSKARALAFETFGQKWAWMYDEEEWNSGPPDGANSANSWTTYFPGGKVGKTLK